MPDRNNNNEILLLPCSSGLMVKFPRQEALGYIKSILRERDCYWKTDNAISGSQVVLHATLLDAVRYLVPADALEIPEAEMALTLVLAKAIRPSGQIIAPQNTIPPYWLSVSPAMDAQ